MRTILIALDWLDAERWAATRRPHVRDSVVATVTPHALDRARGVSATHIAWTPRAVNLPMPVKEKIMEAVTPCFMLAPRPGPMGQPLAEAYAVELERHSVFRRGNLNS